MNSSSSSDFRYFIACHYDEVSFMDLAGLFKSIIKRPDSLTTSTYTSEKIRSKFDKKKFEERKKSDKVGEESSIFFLQSCKISKGRHLWLQTRRAPNSFF